MADNRFYWIKLFDSFYTSDKVDFLMSQKNGSQYIIIYQMLCLKALKTNGLLGRQIGEIFLPYDAEKIKRDCKYFEIDTIMVALELFKKMGLVIQNEDGVLEITKFQKMVGSESTWAKYKRDQRKAISSKEQEKIGQCPNDVQEMSTQSKSKSIELDTTTNKGKSKCLLGYDKPFKVDWCYLNCRKCQECQVSKSPSFTESVKVVEEDELNPEVKALLDSAFPDKRKR